MEGQTNFTWESAAETHVGKVRTINEDSVLNRRDLELWAVADGMGGHSAGADASRLVVEALESTVPAENLEDYSKQVKAALEQANHDLVEKARQEGKGISGSTAAVLFSVANKASIVWVGDSRVYRHRQGKLAQLTRDHNQLEEWITQGLIDHKGALNHAASNVITRAIGAEDQLEPDETVFEVKPSDTYLICSDGLHNEVSDDELSHFLSTGHCVFAAKQLLKLVLEREARDNVSIVVVHARADSESDTRTQINPRLVTD